MISLKINNVSFKTHCLLAFLLRLLCIIYANFHDNFFSLSYTDVDYVVFTDAARYIVNGKSPFERLTYRYTPLLAFMLTPNILLFKDFGKICFSVVDILIPIVIRKILLRENCSNRTLNICTFLWLYNPLTIVISTRGNADSIAVFLVILTLDFLQQQKYITAGLIHGLSIHFRLYPMMFSLAMYLSLQKGFNIIPNLRQLKLVFSCIFSILVLTSVSYYLYGYRFLYESFFYHLIRKDTRHNFSIYFYMLYLSADSAPSIYQNILIASPQIILLILFSYCFSGKLQLPFALLTQAMVMVAYNPVMTSQYIFWFLSLVPLNLPHLKLDVKKSLELVAFWILAKGIWLLFAYLLEFQGFNTFIFIWLSSILFFIANIQILVNMIKYYE
ncbi:GPI mannosyltransferase 1 [Prorops nasuta]|uniref:GPI mannosyltransferase 1 n=1 Tax=Prorops nasuta TaxID=863751 RepID=UPI0034CD215A